MVNGFAVQAVLFTLLSLLGALLIKFHSGFQSTGAVGEGYDYDTLQFFIIGTAVFTGTFGCYIVLREAGTSGAWAFLWKLSGLIPGADLLTEHACCRRFGRRLAGKRSGAQSRGAEPAAAAGEQEPIAPGESHELEMHRRAKILV